MVKAAKSIEALVLTEDARPGAEKLPGGWVQSSVSLRGTSAERVRAFMSRSDLYDNLPDSLMDYTPGYSFRFHQDGKVLLLLVDDCVSLLEPIITEGGKRVAGERRFLTPAGKKALLELLRNIFGPKVRPRC